MTTYFVLVKRGCNDVIVKEKVRKRYVLKQLQYLLHHNPAHAKYVLSQDSVNVIPENVVLQSVLVYYDMDENSN